MHVANRVTFHGGGVLQIKHVGKLELRRALLLI